MQWGNTGIGFALEGTRRLLETPNNLVVLMMPPPTSVLRSDEDPLRLERSDVVEVPLLLSGWQMSALEQAAYVRGMTAAEMVRQVLREFIADHPVMC